MDSNKASNALLDLLHGKLAEHFKSLLESDEGPSASELAQIVKFLKDNGIEATPEQSKPLGDLAKRLPFTNEEEQLRH